MSKHSRASTGASSNELAISLETAREDLIAAESGVAAADAAYQAALPDQPAPALRKLKEAREDATIAVDRAMSIIARLARQLETTVESETEADRRKRYEKAKEVSKAAKARLNFEYPAAATTIHDIIRDIAASDILVIAANQDRPEGAPPIDRAEQFRSLPTHRENVVSKRRVELWAGVGDHKPLPAESQGNISSGRRTASFHTGTAIIEVEKKLFDEITYLPASLEDRSVASLSSSVVLPGLGYGESHYVRPIDSTSPEWIFDRLNEPREPAALDTPREPEVEYELVRG